MADRWHSTIIEVHAQAALAVPAKGSGQDVVPTASFGTGVLIGDGLAVTTLHSVAAVLPGRIVPWQEVEALLPDFGTVRAEIVASFPDLDLAVLRLEGTASISAASLSTEAPLRGDRLIAMGVGDDAISGVSVTVAGVTGDQFLMVSTRRVDSRYWGGPLFDVQGRLVGITLSSVTPRAVSSVVLAAMLAQIREPLTKANPPPASLQ